MAWRSGGNFSEFEIGKLYQVITSDVKLYNHAALWPAAESRTLKLGEVIMMVGRFNEESDWPMFLFDEGRYTPFVSARENPSKYFRKVS